MNKILAFLITILLFGIQKTSAQNYLNYYERINKAEIENLDWNFKVSDSIYQIAFELVKKPFKEDFLLAAINSEKLNDNQKTFDYLKKGISNGLTLKRIKKQLSAFKKSKEYKALKIKYNRLHNDYLNTLNLSLRKEILEMARQDQKARRPILGSSNQMKKTDNLNYNRLIEIIKLNDDKWPGFSTIGEISPEGKVDFDMVGTIAIMPLHFRKKQIRTLEPYMKKAVLNGNMYPYQYARIMDYTINNQIISYKSSRKGTKIKSKICTLYGTFTKEMVCDCEKSNKERKKTGLESLEEFYRKKNSTLKCYVQD